MTPQWANRLHRRTVELFHRLSHGRVIPLNLALLLARVVGEDGLALPQGEERSFGDSLSDPVLAEQLARVELGTWALDAHTILFLQQLVIQREPNAVLEFGSGVSTVCLAHFMNLVGSRDRPCVYFVEQDLSHVEATTSRLQKAGLDHLVRGIHVPLTAESSTRVPCYDIDDRGIARLLGDVRPQLVLVDGPAGPSGARWCTLPAAIDLLAPGATILLDDGLRIGELHIAAEWGRIGGVHVEGVRVTAKGLIELRVSAVSRTR